jgi:hypothetical protein
LTVLGFTEWAKAHGVPVVGDDALLSIINPNPPQLPPPIAQPVVEQAKARGRQLADELFRLKELYRYPHTD